MTKLHSLSLLDNQLPEETRLFEVGINTAYHIGLGYTEINYSHEIGECILAAYEESGMDSLSMDYEHQTFNAPRNGQPAPAAAWFRPVMKDDGLYAKFTKWTPRARQMIIDGEYRFYSPSIETDDEGNITRLHNAALTNLPALSNLRPLTELIQLNKVKEPNMKLLQKYNVQSEDELEKKIEALEGFKANVLSMTAQSSENGALGVVTALAQTAEENRGLIAELKQKIADTEKAAETASAMEQINTAVKDGKVPPAFKDKAIGFYNQFGMAGLNAYLDALPVLPGQKTIEPSAKKSSNLSNVQSNGLGAGSNEVLRRFGYTAEEINAHKPVMLNQIRNSKKDEE